MRNTKRISDPTRNLPTEIQDHITHAPIEDVQVKGNGNEDSKTDEADIRTFTSNSDSYEWEDEREDIYQDYLK